MKRNRNLENGQSSHFGATAALSNLIEKSVKQEWNDSCAFIKWVAREMLTVPRITHCRSMNSHTLLMECKLT